MPRTSSSFRLLRSALGRRALLALFALVLWLGVSPALALQHLAALSAAPGQEQAAPEESGIVFESPRDIARAIWGFYEYQAGKNPGGLERAAEIFDLEGVELGSRSARGRYLMEHRLAEVLDRVLLWDPSGEGFPTVAELAGDSSWEWVATPPGRADLELRLGFVDLGERGWKVDADTVARLPEMFQELRGLPRVSGLEDKPLTLTELVRAWVPEELQGGGFLLEPYQWLGLLVLLFLGGLVERLGRVLLRAFLANLAERSEGIDRKQLLSFERPVGWVVTMLVFMALLPVLDLEPRYRDTLEVAASFVLTVAAVWAAYRLVDVLCWYLAQKAAGTDNRLDDMMVPLVRRTLKVFVVVVGLLFIASRMTGDLWSIAAGLSIGSLALGFAAKDSVENLFGTFTILLDSPFKLEDTITAGGLTGTVEQVGFRSTRVRTVEDTLITVPNSSFISSNIENLSERRRRRVSTTLGLTYDTPPETVEAFCEGVRELIRRHPWTQKDSYHVWFTGYGASALEVTFVFNMDTTHYATFLREQHRINLDVLRLAEGLGVEFAFPTQTVHLARPEDLEHPDVPADQESALELGRRLAGELAERSLGPFAGQRPAEVRYEPDDPGATGPGAGGGGQPAG